MTVVGEERWSSEGILNAGKVMSDSRTLLSKCEAVVVVVAEGYVHGAPKR